MTPRNFVISYYAFAKASEAKTGIHHVATLAQAATESGWGKAAPGNMFFGIKDTDGVNGNEQLVTTTEYSRRADLKFPVIISVTPVVKKGVKMFKYVVKDYFREYKTPEGSFTDHGKFFLENKRYAKALEVKGDPYRFIEEIAKAGYATAPDYVEVMHSIVRRIQKEIDFLKLK